MKNHGLKLLIGSFVFATAVCILGCIWQEYYPSNRGWTGMMTYHCEIHSDRPIEDIVREIERDNESQGDRALREGNERDQDTDFGRMS